MEGKARTEQQSTKKKPAEKTSRVTLAWAFINITSDRPSSALYI